MNRCRCCGASCDGDVCDALCADRLTHERVIDARERKILSRRIARQSAKLLLMLRALPNLRPDDDCAGWTDAVVKRARTLWRNALELDEPNAIELDELS